MRVGCCMRICVLNTLSIYRRCIARTWRADDETETVRWSTILVVTVCVFDLPSVGNLQRANDETETVEAFKVRGVRADGWVCLCFDIVKGALCASVIQVRISYNQNDKTLIGETRSGT